MSHTKSENIEKLRRDCSLLEEQVKLLMRTEIQLRRTKAELVQSKHEINEYNKTLEQKVEARTKELLVTNERLRQEIREREKAEIELKKAEDSLNRAERMEAIGLLAGSVAHDLNNLLTSIIGYPSLMLRKIPDDDPLYLPINAIRKCGEKAAAVVRDLAILSRNGLINTEPVNLNEILRMIIKSPEFVRMKKDHPAVTVHTMMGHPVFTIAGSPVHLYAAIMNVVINAFDAMNRGGTLSISTKNICLDRPRNNYELIGAGEYVTATFTDTGSGISKKDLDRFFEPFYSRKVMGKSGTGLGMALVWGTVKMHKGFIDITSTEGTGTSVILYFPASRAVVLERREERKFDDYLGENESVLIIDDADNQRDICTALLTELNYRSIAVASGEEAIECLRIKKFDVLILDMIMEPGINGLETYKKILALNPGQKAVIVSGFSDSQPVVEAQALGAGAFVRKPFTFETLGVALKKTLHPEIR